MLCNFLAVLCFVVGVSGSAQTNFSVDTNFVSVNYPANAHVFYPWIELTNNTGNVLEMQCVKMLDQKPTNWETWLEDLDSAYSYIPDTVNFFLPAINQSAQYLIVSFHPYNVPGRSTVVLKLYPANAPEDSVLLTYQGNAYRVDDTTAVAEVADWLPDLRLYPQPVQNLLYLSSQNLVRIEDLQVVNLLGQTIALPWGWTPSGQIEVETATLVNGIYFLVLTDGQGKRNVKRFVKE